jgi:RNA polymerase sigma-70 factor (ECF subfamily)
VTEPFPFSRGRASVLFLEPGHGRTAGHSREGAPRGDAGASPGEPTTDRVAENWRLVAAAQSGDTAAFGALYDRYMSVVYRYVIFRVGDRGVAEDLTSETFVRALRRISSVSYRGRDIGAWFVTIARNLILDYVKSGRYRLEVTSAEPREPPQSGETPETAVLAGQSNDELMRCVEALGPDQRECVTLRFLSGLSVAETAEVMGRGEGAIKALQHRAVRRLGQLLPADIR